MTYEDAYNYDLALWFKKEESKKELMKKLIRVEENIAWANSYDYPRPTLVVKHKTKFSLIKFIKSLLP